MNHHHEMRRSRPKSQVMTLDHSSPPPPPQRKNGSLPQQQRWYENDGELKERQLQELKTRMRQMEKTMRWWSDCATNWREKWSQLRLERNHVKEDLKTTQTELERISKELDFYRGRSALCTPTPTTPNANGRTSELNSSHSGGSGAKNKRIQTDAVDYLKTDEVIRLEKSVARYLLMLEEANRTIIAEREDKIILHHTVERLQRDLQDLQELYDNLKKEMYELKDFSEMDDSFCGGHDRDRDLDRDLDHDIDGVAGLSDDEELNGAVGFSPGYGLAIGIENDKMSPLNYQTSLFVDLSERRVNELNVSPPILQIVEDSDLHLRDQEFTTVVSRPGNAGSDTVSSKSDRNSPQTQPQSQDGQKSSSSDELEQMAMTTTTANEVKVSDTATDKERQPSQNFQNQDPEPESATADQGGQQEDQNQGLKLETSLASLVIADRDDGHDHDKHEENDKDAIAGTGEGESQGQDQAAS